MAYPTTRRLRKSMRRVTARIALVCAAAKATGMLTGPARAQTPPAGFDGTKATYRISANSRLRYGDSLLSKHYLTVGVGGMQIKGRGPCTMFVCPVTFNGVDLYARRSRLSLDGAAAGGTGAPGPIRPGGYGGPSKQCAGIARTLRRGDENGEVRALQDILLKAGFDLKADGKYGRKTAAAVTQLQKRARIKADGTVGPKTLAILPC